MGPLNTPVTDITDLFELILQPDPPHSTATAMNALCAAVSISWVPMQCDSLLLQALLLLTGHLLQSSTLTSDLTGSTHIIQSQTRNQDHAGSLQCMGV